MPTDSCTALCRDFSTEEERNLCREKSVDFFKEINTDCVGGDLGLMAWQYRSWTATTYALNPLGWEGTVSGDEERTGVKGGGFQSDRFEDESFVRWGQGLQAALCIDEVGMHGKTCHSLCSSWALGSSSCAFASSSISFEVSISKCRSSDIWL